MLPTKGYFQDIECPYFDNACNRPYCHFRHRKKCLEPPEDSPTETAPEPEVPTYKPTPKSELANIRSHIPISYVPDLAFRSGRTTRPLPKFPITKATYNPTPLSILSSANNDSDKIESDNIKAVREIKLNIASVEYNPEVSLKSEPLEDIDFEDLSAEFDLIDDIIDDSAAKNQPKSDAHEDVVEESAGEVEQPNGEISKKIDQNDKNDKVIAGSEVSEKKVRDGGKDEKRNRSSSGSKSRKSKQHKSSSKTKEKPKEPERRSKSDKKSSRDSRHKSSKDKDRHKSSRKSKERDKDRSKDKDKSKAKDSSSKKKLANNKKRRRSSDTGESSPERKKPAVKKKRKSSATDESSPDRKKPVVKKKRRSSATDESSPDRKKPVVKKKRRSSATDESSPDRKKPAVKKKQRKSSGYESSPEHKKHASKKRSDSESSFSANGDPENDFSDDVEFGDEEETLLECYKIFNEYIPPAEPAFTEPPQELPEEAPDGATAGKKRIAHGAGDSSMFTIQKPIYNKPKSQPSPALAMSNRFKVAKLAQGDNEQRDLANEMMQIKKPGAPSLIDAARIYKMQRMAAAAAAAEARAQAKAKDASNVIDSILNGAKPQNRVRKIAPAQNVNSIQRAKARIEEMARQKAVQTVSKTPAQIQKGGARVAHVPDISLSDIPDVLNADKSKLPINVRTRFLTMIADECVKLYLTKEDAYNRALNEEFSCYEKCKVLTTYKNSAMLAVNRLRKELQERTKAGLGPLGAGESSGSAKSSELKGQKLYECIRAYLLTDEELDIHGYPRESSVPGRAVIKNRRAKPPVALGENQRKCSRCSKIYLVDDDGFVLYEEECVYHPLKKRTLRGEQTYLCCKSNDDAGCVTSNTHVSEMAEEAELEGYQTTMLPEREDDPRNHAVYALDCEMCYTIKGLELTRVTIVDTDCKTVYESLVKPLNPIIDYNTNFSGITREQMERTSTSILQVQANILHLCNSKTILIGHSLESDMKALRIIHGTVIDTSVLFPHKMGLPHKRALRMLASEFLKKIIQNGVSGHDSAEDAITCMELVKWKLREELKVHHGQK